MRLQSNVNDYFFITYEYTYVLIQHVKIKAMEFERKLNTKYLISNFDDKDN